MAGLISSKAAIAAAVAVFAWLSVRPAADAAAQTALIDSLRWQYRILVQCPGAPDMAMSSTQSEGLSVRDVVRVTLDDGFGMALIPVPSSRDDTVARFQILNADNRKRFAEAAGCGENGIAYALIGKDGGRKQQWNRAPAADDVFTLIDGMPMGRQELRDRQ